MKNKFTIKYCIRLAYLLLICNATILNAQLPGNCSGSLPTVAIAGDSWAQYMADDDVYNDAFKMYGHADKICISETYEIDLLCSSNPGPNDYAVSGSEAKEWADEANFDYLQNLIDALNANPSVEFVILSIGGNDILRGRSGGGWYQDMDLDVPGSEAALFSTVNGDTWYIINQVWLRARPDIRFVIMSYDFPNFNVSSLWCGFYACDKREDLSRDANNNGNIDASELMTDQDISNMMLTVEGIRKTSADSNPYVYYDNGMGLTHHFFGYHGGNYPNFNAGTTPAPQGESPYAAGGNLGIPTDRDNFRLVGVCGLPGLISADPIHLDEDAYLFKSKNLFDNLFFDYYRGSQKETFWSEASYDGYVDEITGTTNSTGIRVGDYGGTFADGVSNDYRGIISFNTSSIPDDVVVDGVSLYMMRSGANDNPFDHNDRNPVLDIKSGSFGNNAGLESIDATAAADASNIGCFHGKADQDKYAIRIDLDEAALQYINLTGRTQFRFYFDLADWSPEYINFYDGGGTAARMVNGDQEIKPIYKHWTTRKTTDNQGKVIEEILDKGQIVERKEGFVYLEKMIAQRVINDNTIEEDYIMRDVVEHPGLSKIMSERFGAPGGGFAPFIDVSYSSLLPVELASFTATKLNETALLNWTTLSEINSAYFHIERSQDGLVWTDIGTVESSGNSNETNNYSFIDEIPKIGINYYRLKMEDLDETFEYSEIRNLVFSAGTLEIKAFPNPFRDELNISINGNSERTSTITIHDVLARKVFETQIDITEYNVNHNIDLRQLNKGIYFVTIKVGLKSEIIKVVKE